MQANIQFDFLYETNAKDPHTVWQQLMNIILENKTHKHMIDMVEFTHHGEKVINRNMPFIYEPEKAHKKSSQK